MSKKITLKTRKIKKFKKRSSEITDKTKNTAENQNTNIENSINAQLYINNIKSKNKQNIFFLKNTKTKKNYNSDLITFQKNIYNSNKTSNPIINLKEHAAVDISEKTNLKSKQIKNVFENKNKAAATSKAQIYKGQNAYKNYVPIDRKKYENKHTRPGPQPSSNHIRNISFFDYKPDLCKDWKEAGYCGYGDSCKFVHDRTDYKSGWQIERDWEIEQKQLKESRDENVNTAENEKFLIREENTSQIMHCLICNGNFKDPVITMCKHRFCEKCATDRYKKGKTKCAICKMETDGVFNNTKTPKLINDKNKNDFGNENKDFKAKKKSNLNAMDFAKKNIGFGDESSWTYS